MPKSVSKYGTLILKSKHIYNSHTNEAHTPYMPAEDGSIHTVNPEKVDHYSCKAKSKTKNKDKNNKKNKNENRVSYFQLDSKESFRVVDILDGV